MLAHLGVFGATNSALAQDSSSSAFRTAPGFANGTSTSTITIELFVGMEPWGPATQMEGTQMTRFTRYLFVVVAFGLGLASPATSFAQDASTTIEVTLLVEDIEPILTMEAMGSSIVPVTSAGGQTHGGFGLRVIDNRVVRDGWRLQAAITPFMGSTMGGEFAADLFLQDMMPGGLGFDFSPGPLSSDNPVPVTIVEASANQFSSLEFDTFFQATIPAVAEDSYNATISFSLYGGTEP